MTNEMPVSLVITNGTVIDGTGACPIPGAIVAVDGNRIVAVGRSADFAISPEATIIDAKGGTILPGIIDSHVHTTSDPAVRRSILVGGVTSICDLGSVKSAMPQFEQDYMDQEPVARGFRTGPMLTVPGGLPDALFNAAITSVLTGVCEMLPSGLIDRARKWGWLAQMGRILDKATKLGTTGRAGLNYEVTSPEEAGTAVADLMVDQGIVMVPTLARFRHDLEHGPTPGPEADLLVNLDLLGVRLFHDLGGVVALGTDYNSGLDEKEMMLTELSFFVQAGLTPMEAIQAATSHAARVCGCGDELGTL
jgi:hypothetical protein